MRKVFDDYNYILDIDRISYIYYLIKLNTKHKDKLLAYEMFLSCNLYSIYDILYNHSYYHSTYNIFLIHENKYRIIMSEKLKDKVVNHLVSKYVLFPLLEPKLINTNVATRSGKGTSYGIKYLKKYINNLKINHDDIYVLKFDIHKYFYSINHKILINKLKRVIHDEALLELVFSIINSTNYPYINEVIDKAILNEKNLLKRTGSIDLEKRMSDLDNIPRYSNGKGLPIGNLSSQILAVFYLNDLDHYIKEKLGIKHYIRYMDDFVLIHHDRNYLKYCLEMIKKKLAEFDLRLNNKTQIVNLNQGFCFLGYRFVLRKKKLFIVLRSKTKKRIKKRIIKARSEEVQNWQSIVASYNGYLKNAHCGYYRFIYQI